MFVVSHLLDVTLQFIIAYTYSLQYTFHYMVVTKATCRENTYTNSTMCIPCPSQCTACTSDTNCLKCRKNFYGDLCEIPCLHNCSSHECHIKYGHCTHGCPDSWFASKGKYECTKCPETCSVCNSTSHCFRCQHGFYGKKCSRKCKVGCGTCNHTTGLCLNCISGYYSQGDACPQCTDGCAVCNNSTYCSTCQEAYVDQFLGKCFRKCTDKSEFVSKHNERCGLSLEEINSNQSSCLTVNIERKYTCTTFRPCSDCRTVGGDCRHLNPIRSNKVCIRYEQCITMCNPVILKHEMQNESDGIGTTLCKQTCLVNHSADDNGTLERMCPISMKETITSEEISYMDCFQEPDVIAHSPEELAFNNLMLPDVTINSLDVPAMPIAVFVLALTIVIIVLMAVTVVYLYRGWTYSDQYRCTTKIGMTREVEEGLSTPRCMVSHDNAIPTIYLTPTSEHVYDKPN